MKKKDCFLLDTNSPIDEKSIEKILELYEISAVRTFKIYNGENRIIFCLRNDKIDEFLSETTLALKKEIHMDPFKERVYEVDPKEVCKELTNEQ